MLSPGARVMALWRASIWGQTAAANTGRWAFNVFVAPLTGAEKKQYKEIKLPLNTEKLIELLFR